MTRILFLFIAILTFSFSLHAQTIEDAARYSRLDFGGTARAMGIGGGIGALGTDFAVLSTNPAGLAAYRSSDFMFTPAFKFTKVSSDLEGAGNDTENENSSRLLLDNIGYVYASQPIETKWEAVNFGIGTNKLVDFYREFYYEGTSRGSIVDRFIEQSFGFDPNDLYAFEEGLAYDTEAIFPISDEQGEIIPGEYGSDFQDAPNADVRRSERVKTRGAINEFVISLAGNYNHKLMVGVTFGVPFMNYSVERTYKEENPGQEIPNFNDLTFTEKISTTGAGFNMKVGVIYRPIQMIRVGLAVHTPTRFQLQDTWENSLNYDYTLDGVNSDLTNEAEVDVPFEYSLRTPMRTIGSLAVLFQKRGFISAEMEYLNYAKNSFNLTKNFSDTGTEQIERALNQEIDDAFTSAINLKIGGELALDIFRVRAGYGMFGTSYADKSSFDPSYSIGLGMRQDSYYLDVAFRRSSITEDYSPYSLVNEADEQQVTNESIINKVILTLGFRF